MLPLVAFAYVSGARRRRGRRWPAARTVPFLAGLVTIAIALLPPPASRDDTSFPAHVGQHLLLGMAAPFLVVLGAPLTLALQTLGRPAKTRLLRLVHSRPVAAVSYPVTAWLLFGGSMAMLYLTPLYRLSVEHEWLHRSIPAHFMLVGLLFCWPIVGVDASLSRWRMPFGWRLLYVLAALPFHAFLGLALLSQRTPLAPAIALDDQRGGAGLMWMAGELLGVIAAITIAAQWMTAEERE